MYTKQKQIMQNHDIKKKQTYNIYIYICPHNQYCNLFVYIVQTRIFGPMKRVSSNLHTEVFNTCSKSILWCWSILHISSQSTKIPKPEVRGFWANSLTKPPFGVTSAEVAIICRCDSRTVRLARSSTPLAPVAGMRGTEVCFAHKTK